MDSVLYYVGVVVTLSTILGPVLERIGFLCIQVSQYTPYPYDDNLGNKVGVALEKAGKALGGLGAFLSKYMSVLNRK